MVYVPKWNLEYEAGQISFSRRILGSSGRILEDDIAKCRKCTLLKMTTVAVCGVAAFLFARNMFTKKENSYVKTTYRMSYVRKSRETACFQNSKENSNTKH